MISSDTVICIIRHGETDWNATGRLQGCEDIELNETGRQQAFDLVRILGKEHWDVIITSPLKRAHETARIVADELSVSDIQVVEMLRERDYGEASGLLPEERRLRFHDGIIPGQEEFETLRCRAMESVITIATMYPGKRIIIISHGAFTNSILYTISKGEFGSFKTRLKNGCLNLLKFNGLEWSVTYYNKVPDDFI